MDALVCDISVAEFDNSVLRTAKLSVAASLWPDIIVFLLIIDLVEYDAALPPVV
jgi:hypothetical protein